MRAVADAGEGLMQYVRIRIHARWWLRWYLDGVVIMSHLSGAEPDLGKVQRTVERALVLKVEPVRYSLAA